MKFKAMARFLVVMMIGASCGPSDKSALQAPVSKNVSKRQSHAGSLAAQSSQRLKDLSSQAMSFVRVNNWIAAEEKFREILQEHPNHAQSLLQLGVALERQSRPEEALNCYLKLIQAGPANGSTFSADVAFSLNVGELSLRQGRSADALIAYSRVLQVGENRAGSALPSVSRVPGNIEDTKSRALVIGGISAILWHNSEDAEALLKKAIQIKPTMPEPHFYLGFLYDKQGKYDRAKLSLDKAKQNAGGRVDILDGIKRVQRRHYWAY